MWSTHEVTNQSPALADCNLFETDRVLREGLAREGGAWAVDDARETGRRAGGEAMAWGEQANRYPPELRPFDRAGRRLDVVDYHPSYHLLMAAAIEQGLHAAPWRTPGPGAHVARAARYFLFTQAEQGHGCPVTMTFAVVPALRHQPDLATVWEPALTSLVYDRSSEPVARKLGATAGMAMTEKQGGSDLRAITTRATPAGTATGAGTEYRLVGHKWFCSAPMSDVFLTLAHTDRGPTCFLLPRILPDGTRNALQLQRLKDKLGNRSNASSEIELHDAHAWMVGEDGRGIRTIIDMVAHTRLDCVIGSSALMRQSAVQAIHHCTYRAAFGRTLADQPLMRSVLADLALESEAATTLMLRLARAYDEAPTDAGARTFARIATAISKYWVCKRAVAHVGEALEALGGNGYVEESPLPRLFREAPVNSVWEGSGNVICLDVLRAIHKEHDALLLVLDEIGLARGGDRRFDAWLDETTRALPSMISDEAQARRVAGALALGLQASLLLRHAPATVAEAFVQTRLVSPPATTGAWPGGLDTAGIVGRAFGGAATPSRAAARPAGAGEAQRAGTASR